MTRLPTLVALASLAAAPACADVIIVNQAVFVAGDVATDQEAEEPIDMPALPPNTETISVQIDGTLTMFEPFQTVADPGPLEKITGDSQVGIDSGYDTVFGFDIGPDMTWQAQSTYAAIWTTAYDFSFDLDPYTYPSAIYFNLWGGATCTGCDLPYSDDVGGQFSGMMTTTFDPPAPVPEPASAGLLLVGLTTTALTLSRKRKYA
jgi:hypothetical protein